MRIMAVDYGDARTGVAISDATGFLTGFTTVVPGRRAEPVAQKIAALMQEHGVEEVVLGFPRNMDGTEGARADLYRAFAALVEEASGLRLVFWKPMKQHRKNVDAVAASLILEGYLTFKRGQSAL